MSKVRGTFLGVLLFVCASAVAAPSMAAAQAPPSLLGEHLEQTSETELAVVDCNPEGESTIQFSFEGVATVHTQARSTR